MIAQPGLIVLLGSGETAPTIRRVYNWLFERLKAPIHIGILETPAGFEPNSDKVAQYMAEFMTHRLQNFGPRISIIPARKRGTAFSPDKADIVTPLLETNVIMMGPGSPTYAARQLLDSVAWHTLVARHRLGAALIFASATTIASSVHALPVYEIYKVGEDLHWKRGLDFFKPFGLSLVFIPHWNNNDGGTELDTSHCYVGTLRYNQLIEMLPKDVTIVGIDEHTALVVDPQAETCRVMGVGNVRIVRGDQEKQFPNGQTFSVHELGSFYLPAPQTGIPAEVWQRVTTAFSSAEGPSAESGTFSPSSEVITLLEQRNAARSRRDWPTADALREKIEARGWKVIDMPDGSVLEPA